MENRGRKKKSIVIKEEEQAKKALEEFKIQKENFVDFKKPQKCFLKVEKKT